MYICHCMSMYVRTCVYVSCMYYVCHCVRVCSMYVCASCVYVIVCVCIDEEEGDEDGDTEEEQEQEVVTVVYFWQGRDANNMGWLHFTHRSVHINSMCRYKHAI